MASRIGFVHSFFQTANPKSLKIKFKFPSFPFVQKLRKRRKKEESAAVVEIGKRNENGRSITGRGGEGGTGRSPPKEIHNHDHAPDIVDTLPRRPNTATPFPSRDLDLSFSLNPNPTPKSTPTPRPKTSPTTHTPFLISRPPIPMRSSSLRHSSARRALVARKHYHRPSILHSLSSPSLGLSSGDGDPSFRFSFHASFASREFHAPRGSVPVLTGWNQRREFEQKHEGGDGDLKLRKQEHDRAHDQNSSHQPSTSTSISTSPSPSTSSTLISTAKTPLLSAFLSSLPMSTQTSSPLSLDPRVTINRAALQQHIDVIRLLETRLEGLPPARQGDRYAWERVLLATYLRKIFEGSGRGNGSGSGNEDGTGRAPDNLLRL